MKDIYNFIEGLWINKKIDVSRINKLKTKNWITNDEANTIKSKKQKKDSVKPAKFEAVKKKRTRK